MRALENANAFPLSGGALALGVLNIPYKTIVDLQDIPELIRIFEAPNGITIGSGVMLQDVVDSPAVPPIFKRAITRTLPPNIRNNTSVLESLLVPQPPPEWAAALAAYETTVTMLNYDHEYKQFTMAETTLTAGADAGKSLRDGLMMSLFIPTPHPAEVFGSTHIARTPAGNPIVNVTVAVKINPEDNTVNTAFAALCGVSQKVAVELLSLGDLCGKPLTAESIAAQAAQVPYVLDPPDNYLGSAEYRKTMAATLVRRALDEAAAHNPAANT